MQVNKPAYVGTKDHNSEKLSNKNISADLYESQTFADTTKAQSIDPKYYRRANKHQTKNSGYGKKISNYSKSKHDGENATKKLVTDYNGTEFSRNDSNYEDIPSSSLDDIEDLDNYEDDIKKYGLSNSQYEKINREKYSDKSEIRDKRESKNLKRPLLYNKKNIRQDKYAKETSKTRLFTNILMQSFILYSIFLIILVTFMVHQLPAAFSFEYILTFGSSLLGDYTYKNQSGVEAGPGYPLILVAIVFMVIQKFVCMRVMFFISVLILLTAVWIAYASSYNGLVNQYITSRELTGFATESIVLSSIILAKNYSSKSVQSVATNLPLLASKFAPTVLVFIKASLIFQNYFISDTIEFSMTRILTKVHGVVCKMTEFSLFIAIGLIAVTFIYGNINKQSFKAAKQKQQLNISIGLAGIWASFALLIYFFVFAVIVNTHSLAIGKPKPDKIYEGKHPTFYARPELKTSTEWRMIFEGMKPIENKLIKDDRLLEDWFNPIIRRMARQNVCLYPNSDRLKIETIFKQLQSKAKVADHYCSYIIGLNENNKIDIYQAVHILYQNRVEETIYTRLTSSEIYENGLSSLLNMSESISSEELIVLSWLREKADMVKVETQWMSPSNFPSPNPRVENHDLFLLKASDTKYVHLNVRVFQDTERVLPLRVVMPWEELGKHETKSFTSSNFTYNAPEHYEGERRLQINNQVSMDNKTKPTDQMKSIDLSYTQEMNSEVKVSPKGETENPSANYSSGNEKVEYNQNLDSDTIRKLNSSSNHPQVKIRHTNKVGIGYRQLNYRNSQTFIKSNNKDDFFLNKKQLRSSVQKQDYYKEGIRSLKVSNTSKSSLISYLGFHHETYPNRNQIQSYNNQLLRKLTIFDRTQLALLDSNELQSLDSNNPRSLLAIQYIRHPFFLESSRIIDEQKVRDYPFLDEKSGSKISFSLNSIFRYMYGIFHEQKKEKLDVIRSSRLDSTNILNKLYVEKNFNLFNIYTINNLYQSHVETDIYKKLSFAKSIQYNKFCPELKNLLDNSTDFTTTLTCITSEEEPGEIIESRISNFFDYLSSDYYNQDNAVQAQKLEPILFFDFCLDEKFQYRYKAVSKVVDPKNRSYISLKLAFSDNTKESSKPYVDLGGPFTDDLVEEPRPSLITPRGNVGDYNLEKYATKLITIRVVMDISSAIFIFCISYLIDFVGRAHIFLFIGSVFLIIYGFTLESTYLQNTRIISYIYKIPSSIRYIMKVISFIVAVGLGETTKNLLILSAMQTFNDTVPLSLMTVSIAIGMSLSHFTMNKLSQGLATDDQGLLVILLSLGLTVLSIIIWIFIKRNDKDYALKYVKKLAKLDY